MTHTLRQFNNGIVSIPAQTSLLENNTDVKVDHQWSARALDHRSPAFAWPPFIPRQLIEASVHCAHYNGKDMTDWGFCTLMLERSERHITNWRFCTLMLLYIRVGTIGNTHHVGAPIFTAVCNPYDPELFFEKIT
jgi:hypothetical protein